MRIKKIILHCLFFLVLLTIERQYPIVPVTWIILSLFSLHTTVQLLFLLGIALLADLAIGLPFGTTAVVMALLLSTRDYSPKNSILRSLYYVAIGLFLGLIYGWLTVNLSLQLVFATGICMLLIHSIRVATPSIEEIGNA